MNNKGFTLIELIASVMLLAVLMTITSVSIVNFISSSKEKSFDVLVENIKIGAQGLFEECENNNVLESGISGGCPSIDSCGDMCTTATISLESLIKLGFLKSNSEVEVGGVLTKIIENPLTNDNMNSCKVMVRKEVDANNYSVSYKFSKASAEEYCPTDDDYDKLKRE